MKYRTEVDGLRAIAVLSVVLFHFGFEYFPGGYVGVDVFFVISGYLITRLISEEIGNTRDFSFSNFYVRRARRLFPALFFTLCVCTILAAIQFSPDDLENYGGSLIHAVLSLSNFFFWAETGYFDTAAHVKPLLHTWSLSVEEQFYMLWPLTLLILLKISSNRYFVCSFLLITGFLSLYLNHYFLGSDNIEFTRMGWLFEEEKTVQQTTFFLAPFRVYEFAIGALLVWMPAMQNGKKSADILLSLLTLLGVALIGYATAVFNKETPFPSYNALIPCVGAGLVIFSGKNSFSNIVLSNRVMVWVGLISYSLYLAHWPIYVFWQYYTFSELSGTERMLLLFTAFVISYLMYRYVETPFRRVNNKSYSGAAFGFVCAFLSLLLILPAANMWAKEGWKWRIPESMRQALNDIDGMEEAAWAYMRSMDSERIFPDDKRLKVLILGDSHGNDLTNAFSKTEFMKSAIVVRYLRINEACFRGFYDYKGFVEFNKKNPPMISGCKPSFNFSNDLPNWELADIVIISTKWENEETVEQLDGFYDYYLGRNPKAKIIVMGRTVEFGNVPNQIHKLGRMDRNAVEAVVTSTRVDMVSVNNAVKELAKRWGVDYVDRDEWICPKDRENCYVLDDEGNLLFYDYGHWTLDGAKFFGNRMIEEGVIEKLIRRNAGRKLN